MHIFFSFFPSDLVVGSDAYFCIYLCFFFSLLLRHYRSFFVCFCLKLINKNNHRHWADDEHNGDFISFGVLGVIQFFIIFAFHSEKTLNTTQRMPSKLSHLIFPNTWPVFIISFVFDEREIFFSQLPKQSFLVYCRCCAEYTKIM